jgi:ubiquinone/menaquinone biosynthesis C-methylase UbiE
MARPFVLPLIVFLSACAQGITAPPRPTEGGFPPPDRPVAAIIVSHSGPEKDRDAAGEAEKTMAALPLAPGVVVADIGAGDGYFTTRLARRLGANGQVVATEVMPNYLDGLKARIAREGLSNVSFVLGGYDDPKLAPASVNVVLMVRMYHEIEQPYAFIWRLRDTLQQDAVVAVSERDRATEYHGTPPALLACEFAAVGYEQVGLVELGGDNGYLALFKATRPRPAPSEIKACASW